MSRESKFTKLRLPNSKKNKITSSQISAFFANSTPSTSTNSEGNTQFRTHDDEDSNKSEKDTEYQLSSSLPERQQSESKSIDSRPLFASFEAVKPSKMPRIDQNKSTNRNSIKEFFTTTINDNDFESPPAKAAKKAATFKTRKPSNALKRQPKIKNALLKREQIISNIIAEQSIADNIDPNEMQMALALSKSEMDTCRIEGDDEASSGSANSMEAICNKLEEFGYRVGRVNGNHQFYGATKVKAKWANKFTPLTLRNAERQQEKVNKKMEEFLNMQYFEQKDLETCSPKPFILRSSFLSHMIAENCIHQFHRNFEFSSINDFYVANICEPSHNKIGNLLKDFHAIPGRDRSPQRSQCDHENMVQRRKDHRSFNPDDKGEINDPINISTNVKSIPTEEIRMGSSSNERDNRKSYRPVSPDLFMEEEEVPVTENSTNNAIPVTTTPNVINHELNVDVVTLSSESNSNGILICENYSSDEVKTANNSGIWSQDLIYTLQNRNDEDITDEPEKIVDLTQEDSSESTQSDLNCDTVREEDALQNSLKSTESNSTELHLSQDSTSSIIVLSDDEVNYSIQAACELDLNDSSSDKLEKDYLNESRKSGAGTSSSCNKQSSLNMCMKNNKSIESSAMDRNENVESGSECNNICQTSHESDVDKINYSLVHEVMSRSFEEFVEIHDSNLHDKNEASPKGSPFLELTRSKLFPDEQKNEPSTSRCASYTYPETCDRLHDNVSHSESTIEEDLYLREFNVITSPRYTEFIGNQNNSSVYLAKSFRNKEIEAVLHSNDVGCFDDVPYLELTQSTPPNSGDNNDFSANMSVNNASIKSCKKFKKTRSDSLLMINNKTPKSLKRFSSNNKFDEFLNNDSLDEFDRLVYVDTERNNKKINKSEIVNKLSTDGLDECQDDSIDEISYDNKQYLVKTKNIKPKPDYQRMDSPTRLKELNRFGLKPLKRKHAIVMLEYIYNETHPLMDDESDTHDSDIYSQIQKNPSLEDDSEEMIETKNILSKYDLKDCDGSLIAIENGHHHEVENEEFIFQTNIRSKISTALLPLHLAWFNLVKSSEKLREAILYYEPIDLQEIFTFFKNIGYRYDPKDLKRFFDGRSIIFQYDLNKDGSNRHIRKSQKQKKKNQ